MQGHQLLCTSNNLCVLAFSSAYSVTITQDQTNAKILSEVAILTRNEL